MNKLLNEGGIAFNVLENLTGYKSKIIINRLFDNNEDLYYEICEERIKKEIWNNDFIKYLDILFKKYPTIIIEKILNILTNNIQKNDNTIIPNNIYKINCPCVIGINGHFNKNTIPGVINEHLYSVIGISIDKYNNKYLHVFNLHHNVEGRQTIYKKSEDNFISKIDKNRYGKWSLNETILFMSDLTYSKII